MKTKLSNKMINMLLIIVTFSILVFIGYAIICRQFIYPRRYNKYVTEAAKENNVDPNLIFAIIKQESGFNKKACSNKGAKGLMQVLESTAQEIAQNINQIDINNIDLHDAKTNIYIGTKYFRLLLDRYDGNINLAICAYNAGLGNVDKWITSEHIYTNSKVNISNIPFKETKEYLVNVLRYYNKYVEIY